MNPLDNLNSNNPTNNARKKLKEVREAFESAAETCKLMAQTSRLTRSFINAQVMVMKAQCASAIKLADSIAETLKDETDKKV